MKKICKCGKEVFGVSKSCRECFIKNKRGQLSRSQSGKNRFDKRKLSHPKRLKK